MWLWPIFLGSRSQLQRNKKYYLTMLTPPQIICMSRLVRILIWSSMNWMWTLDVAPRALPLSGPMEPFQWRPPPDASEGIPIPKGCRSKPLGGGTSWWDVLVGNCHGFSGWSSEIPQNGDQNFVKSMYLVFENDIYIYICIYIRVFRVPTPSMVWVPR